jgi:hypothetical protein
MDYADLVRNQSARVRLISSLGKRNFYEDEDSHDCFRYFAELSFSKFL